MTDLLSPEEKAKARNTVIEVSKQDTVCPKCKGLKCYWNVGSCFWDACPICVDKVLWGKIYDIVLAIRTEGVAESKIKALARADTYDIMELLPAQKLNREKIAILQMCLRNCNMYQPICKQRYPECGKDCKPEEDDYGMADQIIAIEGGKDV